MITFDFSQSIFTVDFLGMGAVSTDIWLNWALDGSGIVHGSWLWWIAGVGTGAFAQKLLNQRRAHRKTNQLFPFQASCTEDAEETQYQRLYEETPAMMHAIDKQGRIVSVNHYWLEKLGYAKDAVIGQALLSFVAPNFQSKVRHILSDLKANTPCRDKYCQFIKNNGEPMDVLLSTVADCDEKHCSGHSFGVLVDITERNRAKQKLRRNETLMRAINNLPPTGIFVMDCHTNEALFINDEFYRIWRLSHLQTEVTSRQLSGEQLLAECLSHIDLSSFVATSTAKDFSDGDKIVEDEVPLLDGRTLRRIYGPIRENNITFAYLYVFEDITERKLAVEQLAKATAEAESANKAKSEFLANMSHELRSPLHAILGFTHILKTADPTPEQKENLDIIYNSSEHLLALINDILDISKIEAGQAVVKEDEFDLHYLLDELQQMFEKSAQQKGLQLEVVRAPQLPNLICSDRLKLRQILTNLLSNAIKFTTIGKVTLAAKCDCTTQVPTLSFTVTDTGPGIAIEDQHRLFEAFFQTETGLTTTEGTGLGLAISNEYAQLLGGQLSVTSQLSKGATFTVRIPVDIVDKSAACRSDACCNNGIRQQLESTYPSVRVASKQAVPKVLVADDLAINRKLLSHVLSRAGFEVKTVENGKDAIALWKSWQPDLIWMDMRMPVMNGEDAVRHIRTQALNHQTRIIGLSASAFENDVAAAIDSGCDDFVGKPIQAAEILEKTAQLLGVDYQQQEIEHSTRSVPSRLTPALIESAPSEWRYALSQATLDLNEGAILALAEQLPAAQDELKSAIAHCVKNLAYKQILQVLQEAETAIPS